MIKFLEKISVKKEIEAALSSSVLTDEKLAYLKKRAEESGLGQGYLAERQQESYKNKVNSIIKRINANKRFSPADEEALRKIGSDLKVNPSFDGEYNRFRALWEYENDGDINLVPISAVIMLAKGEQCYFRAAARWKQHKVSRVRQGYVGASVSFRVAKGVRVSTGRAVPVYREYEGLSDIASGTLYLTDKRIIFIGDRKSSDMAYKKLLDVKVFTNGIEIIKNSGKPDYFMMRQEDSEYANIIIHELNKVDAS